MHFGKLLSLFLFFFLLSLTHFRKFDERDGLAAKTK